MDGLVVAAIVSGAASFIVTIISLAFKRKSDKTAEQVNIATIQAEAWVELLNTYKQEIARLEGIIEGQRNGTKNAT